MSFYPRHSGLAVAPSASVTGAIGALTAGNAIVAGLIHELPLR